MVDGLDEQALAQVDAIKKGYVAATARIMKPEELNKARKDIQAQMLRAFEANNAKELNEATKAWGKWHADYDWAVTEWNKEKHGNNKYPTIEQHIKMGGTLGHPKVIEGVDFSKIIYSDVDPRILDFKQVDWENVTFVNCTFGQEFSKQVLKNAHFQDCEFKPGTNFAMTYMENVIFEKSCKYNGLTIKDGWLNGVTVEVDEIFGQKPNLHIEDNKYGSRLNVRLFVNNQTTIDETTYTDKSGNPVTIDKNGRAFVHFMNHEDKNKEPFMDVQPFTGEKYISSSRVNPNPLEGIRISDNSFDNALDRNIPDSCKVEMQLPIKEFSYGGPSYYGPGERIAFSDPDMFKRIAIPTREWEKGDIDLAVDYGIMTPAKEHEYWQEVNTNQKNNMKISEQGKFACAADAVKRQNIQGEPGSVKSKQIKGKER